jgi:hypothetical protein
MTLWQRTVDGIALCAIAVGVPVVGYVLYLSGVPGLLHIGMMLGVLSYLFGLMMFGLGLILIAAGVIGHFYAAWQRRRKDA